MRAAVLLLSLVGVAGCAHYQAKPLDPNATAVQFEQRRLDDLRLTAFLAAAAVASNDTSPATLQRWNLTTLTRAALYFHPDLDLARSKLALARAGGLTARQRPNPQLSLSGAYTLATTAPPLILSGLIDIVLETFGKREARTDQADALSEAARYDLQNAEWIVRGRVRAALIDVWGAAQRSAATDARLDLQRHLVAMLERRQAAGEGSSIETARERIVLAQLEVDARDIARLQAAARARLATAIGVPVVALDGVSFTFDAIKDPVSPAPNALAADRLSAIVSRADVAAARSGYDAAEAGLRLQIANQYPNFGVGGGYTTDQGAQKPGGQIALVLPVRNHNEGPVAEAQARRDQAAAALTSVQATIVGQLDAGTAALASATASLASADALAAEQSRRQARLDRAFALGAIDRPTLVAGQLEAATIAASRVDLVVAQRQALGLVEDALQRPLFGGPATPSSETNPRAPAQAGAELRR